MGGSLSSTVSSSNVEEACVSVHLDSCRLFIEKIRAYRWYLDSSLHTVPYIYPALFKNALDLVKKKKNERKPYHVTFQSVLPPYPTLLILEVFCIVFRKMKT